MLLPLYNYRFRSYLQRATCNNISHPTIISGRGGAIFRQSKDNNNNSLRIPFPKFYSTTFRSDEDYQTRQKLRDLTFQQWLVFFDRLRQQDNDRWRLIHETGIEYAVLINKLIYNNDSERYSIRPSDIRCLIMLLQDERRKIENGESSITIKKIDQIGLFRLGMRLTLVEPMIPMKRLGVQLLEGALSIFSPMDAFADFQEFFLAYDTPYSMTEEERLADTVESVINLFTISGRQDVVDEFVDRFIKHTIDRSWECYIKLDKRFIRIFSAVLREYCKFFKERDGESLSEDDITRFSDFIHALRLTFCDGYSNELSWILNTVLNYEKPLSVEYFDYFIFLTKYDFSPDELSRCLQFFVKEDVFGLECAWRLVKYMDYNGSSKTLENVLDCGYLGARFKLLEIDRESNRDFEEEKNPDILPQPFHLVAKQKWLQNISSLILAEPARIPPVLISLWIEAAFALKDWEIASDIFKALPAMPWKNHHLEEICRVYLISLLRESTCAPEFSLLPALVNLADDFYWSTAASLKRVDLHAEVTMQVVESLLTIKRIDLLEDFIFVRMGRASRGGMMNRLIQSKLAISDSSRPERIFRRIISSISRDPKFKAGKGGSDPKKSSPTKSDLDSYETLIMMGTLPRDHYSGVACAVWERFFNEEFLGSSRNRNYYKGGAVKSDGSLPIAPKVIPSKSNNQRPDPRSLKRDPGTD